MLPKLGASKLATAWLAVMITASALSFVDGGWLRSWLALEPGQIARGEVWRLVTWVLIEAQLVPFVMTCLAIWKLGSELAAEWGEPRLRRYLLAMFVLGGAVTSLVALALGEATISVVGGFGVLDALGIAWLRKFPHGTLTFWGAVEVRGGARIPVVIAINVFFAIFIGLPFVPALAICAGALLYPH